MMRVFIVLCLVSSTVWADVSADEICGQDRRCRLELFEIRQQQRRLERERQRREISAVEAKRLEAQRLLLLPVREARRWGVELMLNPNTAAGSVSGLASAQLTPQLRLEAMVGAVESSSYRNSTYTSFSGVMVGLRLRWFFLRTEFSPYASLGAFGHSLDLSADSWREPAPGEEWTGNTYKSLTGRAHVGMASFGLEHNFRWGLRLSAELQVFDAFYVQAKDRETLLPDTATRDAVREAYDDLRVGGGFAAGWSF